MLHKIKKNALLLHYIKEKQSCIQKKKKTINLTNFINL